jgi:Ca-activated chloride channel homolog
MKLRDCLVVVLVLAGCAASDGESQSVTPSGSVGVTQGGPEDAAHFRAVIDAGQIPEASLLDQVGFFAEHALDQPEAECGEVVCTHPSLAVAPRFDEQTWTMAFVSMNSAVSADARPRKPVHLVVAVEASDAARSLTGDGQALFQAIFGEMQETDRLSIVTFGATSTALVLGAIPGESLLDGVVLPAAANDDVDLYGGIAAASEALHTVSDFSGDTRVLLLTTGQANAGITDPARIEGLVEGMVREGTPFSVLGVSDTFEATLPRAIAELGAGSYAFAENQADLLQIVTEQTGVHLVPLAREVELRVVPSRGYRVGRIYGARRAVVEDGAAVLRTPALFLGTRSGSSDTSGGRRGGGGGLFVELLADSDAAVAVDANAPAFTLETSFEDVDAGVVVSYSREVTNDLPPGVKPAENWPHFSEPEYGKAFMMLNMYLALRAMVDLYESGDCGPALGVSYMMEPGVEEWQRRFDDPDIAVDGDMLLGLRRNIDELCRATPVPPSNYEAGCFAL